MTAWASLEEAMSVGWGIERSFLCHMHDDTTASASVNSITGWYYCYSCHGSGKFDLSRMEIDPYSVRRSLIQMERQLNAEPTVYSEAWLNTFDSLGPGDYWLSRYSEEACRFYRLGEAPDATYATIPVRDPSGKVMGIIRRDLTGNDRAKYRYPSGVDMSRYAFGYHQLDGPAVVLVEGASDVVAVKEAGFNAGLASYGSGFSNHQGLLLRRYAPEKVLVAYDMDQAGEDGYERVQRNLGTDLAVERLWWEDYKDLSAIPLDERREMLAEVLNPKKVKIRVAKSGHSGLVSST